MTPISSLLKELTEQNHRESEKVFASQIMRLKNAQDYGKLLKLIYLFFNPLYQTCYPLLEDWIADLPQRRPPEWIRKDLEILGIHQEILEKPVKLQSIATPAAALGAFYVWEGSSNGGPFIKTMLKRLGYVPETAMQYFEGYGPQTADTWKRFQQQIDQLQLTEAQRQEAVTTAKATFDAFARHLQMG